MSQFLDSECQEIDAHLIDSSDDDEIPCTSSQPSPSPGKTQEACPPHSPSPSPTPEEKRSRGVKRTSSGVEKKTTSGKKKMAGSGATKLAETQLAAIRAAQKEKTSSCSHSAMESTTTTDNGTTTTVTSSSSKLSSEFLKEIRAKAAEAFTRSTSTVSRQSSVVDEIPDLPFSVLAQMSESEVVNFTGKCFFFSYYIQMHIRVTMRLHQKNK